MTRLFLDTNIVVDLLDRREPFCHDAARLFTMAYNKQVQLIVSPMKNKLNEYNRHDTKTNQIVFEGGDDAAPHGAHHGLGVGIQDGDNVLLDFFYQW